MSKQNLFLVFIFFSTLFSFSQNQFIFKGKLINKTTKTPIESATIYLTREKDSAVLEYTISNKQGAFEFKVAPQNTSTTLKVSFPELEIFTKNIQTINNDVDFGIIELSKLDYEIETVLIKNDIPPIRIKKDTLEFNAASFKLRPDANVETLLKQLPGVEIDADGKITVNGKEVNQILVNGKPFFDKDGKVALQNLPSTIINKVQVTDTKTKKEEKTDAVASSNNASINLTIDEKKNKGFFGKALAGYGSDERYESSGIINYFKNKTKVSVLASANNINSVGFSMDEVFDNMGGGRNGSRMYSKQNSGSKSGITESNLVGANYSDNYFEKVDFSSSFFRSGTSNRNKNKTNNTTFLPNGTFKTNYESSTKTDSDYNDFSFMTDIKIDTTMSIVFEPKMSYNKRTNYNSTRSNSFENSNLLNDFTSDNISESLSKTFQSSTTFTKSFRKKGRNISLVLNNENNSNDDDVKLNSVTNFYQNSDPSDIRNQISNRKNTTEKYRLNFEYAEPITDSLTVKLGSIYDYKFNGNDEETFDFNNSINSFSNRNDLFSNTIKSKTSELYTYAGISVNKKKYNFDVELGTMSLHNVNTSDYLGLATSLDKNFMLPEANVHGSYKFSKSKNIWFNYNVNYSMPSTTQLLPIQNVSNSLNTIVGNPDLNINKNHSVYLSYRNFDYATRSGYGFYTGINYYENQVTSKTIYDANRKRTTTYVDINGNNNTWFGLYWNKSIKKEKVNYRYEFRVSNNLGYDKGFVNGELYTSSSYSFTPSAKFNYEITDKLTIAPSYNFVKEFVSYSNYTIDKTSFYSHRMNLQITSYWPKNWTFGNDFGYNFNSNLGAGFKKDFYLWNTSLAYSFYKDKFLAKVKVYDILNQNQSNKRTISATSIIDEENVVLKRYVMFSLTYKIHMFDSKAKEKKGGTPFRVIQ
jgi:hypothetical protein